MFTHTAVGGEKRGFCHSLLKRQYIVELCWEQATHWACCLSSYSHGVSRRLYK